MHELYEFVSHHFLLVDLNLACLINELLNIVDNFAEFLDALLQIPGD